MTFAQLPQIDPRMLSKPDLEGKVTRVELASRFVATILLPEAVNSVVVGDPSAFQVEHSEREPKLVFVKAISAKPAETNLLISTIRGHQVSLLLVSQGESAPAERTRVDFLVKYEPRGSFLVTPSAFPFAIVGQTVPLRGAAKQTFAKSLACAKPETGGDAPRANLPDDGLERLLEQQEKAPLPVLYGEHINPESVDGNRVRAGVSRAIDGGDKVVVLFSVVNPTKRAILLMPPQVQLGGKRPRGNSCTAGSGRQQNNCRSSISVSAGAVSGQGNARMVWCCSSARPTSNRTKRFSCKLLIQGQWTARRWPRLGLE